MLARREAPGDGSGVLVQRTTAALTSRESTPTTRLANVFTAKRYVPCRSPSSRSLVTRCVTVGVTLRSHAGCHKRSRTVVEPDATGAADAATRRPSVVVRKNGWQIDDPLALTLAVMTLMGAALQAGYVPAWKASHIDPMTMQCGTRESRRLLTPRA